MLVLTLMVRDEADVIAATIEHHLDQGVDHIIVTDNDSVDGTREILEQYARVAPVTVLRDDARDHRQGQIVTAMARRAATEFGADWVINGDADEFVVPVDRRRRLADVFAELDPALGAFSVPVVNMVGRPGRRGTGFDRLVLRDARADAMLESTGIHAHPTPNAIHVGDPTIEVQNGNHHVSIPFRDDVPEALRLEVLHFPWRSWRQLETKTLNMGRTFEQTKDVRPSPKHHIMRDLRRLRLGMLEPFYLRRLPDVTGDRTGFVEDTWFARHMHGLLERAVLRDLLAATLESDGDEPYSDEEIRALRAESDRLFELDERFNAVAESILQDVFDLHRRTLELSDEVVQYAAEQQRLRTVLAEQAEQHEAELDAAETERSLLRAEIAALEASDARIRNHPLVRAGLAGRRTARRVLGRAFRHTDSPRGEGRTRT